MITLEAVIEELENTRRVLEDFCRNEPLTWDELEQMKGKPVWMEFDLDAGSEEIRNKSRGWFIIWEFESYKDFTLLKTESGFVFRDITIGTHWKAYRKER